MKDYLWVKNLKVTVEKREIIKGVDLKLKTGETHALMGPNGSGKSTLAFALTGHPRYKITGGKILICGKDITNNSPEERARKGLFLSFQYPSEIEGVSIYDFLRAAYNNMSGKKQLSVAAFYKLLQEKAKMLKLDKSFLERPVNSGFSGGEKKKSEMLQLAVLEPKAAILDETDSGLDIDALKAVSMGINRVQKACGMAILLITHYQRILNYVKPDRVHVLINGKIAATGGKNLALGLEKKGYQWIKKTGNASART